MLLTFSQRGTLLLIYAVALVLVTVVVRKGISGLAKRTGRGFLLIMLVVFVILLLTKMIEIH